MSRNNGRGQQAAVNQVQPGDRVTYRQSPHTTPIKGTVNDVQRVPNGFGGSLLSAHIRWDNGASAWTPLTRSIEVVGAAERSW